MTYSPRGLPPPSTIGANELNFRVRYVTGCTLIAKITKRPISNLVIDSNIICKDEHFVKKKHQVLRITYEALDH